MSIDSAGSGGLRPGAGVPWLSGEGESADVVLSSRVRLARNLAGVRFVGKTDRRERMHVLEACKERIGALGPAGSMVWIDLHEASPTERTLLVERHLISKQHSKSRGGNSDDLRSVVFSVPDERLSIMINEEDHLRLQAVLPGLSLDACWRKLDAIDDSIGSQLVYAFSPRFGYLTACPTNVGTGLRMSAMLHLPALRLTGDLDKVKRAANDISLAVRGFYGEGSEAFGDLYQLSNQTTLGKSEETILAELQQDILPRIVEYERAARRELLAKRRLTIEDQVFRAFCTLVHARLLGTEESMTLLSMVRLGVVAGILPGVPQARVNRLLLLVQPGHLQLVAGKVLDQEQRKGARAELVRRELGDQPLEEPR